MRKMVTRSELVSLINGELSQLGVPDGIRAVEGVFRLRAPDSDGVNWSDQLSFTRGPGDVVEFYLNDIQAAVHWARTKYNLTPENDPPF